MPQGFVQVQPYDESVELARASATGVVAVVVWQMLLGRKTHPLLNLLALPVMFVLGALGYAALTNEPDNY